MAGSRNPTHYDGDLPRALLDAAKRRIAADGVDALTLRALARDVGVSHAAPGHHFGSRAGLLGRLAQEGFRSLHAAMTAEIESVGADADAAARMEAAGRGYVKFCAREPALFAVVFRFAALDWQDARLVQAATEAYGVLVACVRSLAAERGLPVTSEETAIVEAWAMVHGLAALWHSGALPMLHPDTTLEELGARVAATFTTQLLR